MYQLVEHLELHGYTPIKGTNGSFSRNIRRTKFCLCVDDFGIKYYNENDANHLINAIREKYTITVDKEGKNYCGYTFDWHYNEGYVDMSMPGNATSALNKVNH